MAADDAADNTPATTPKISPVVVRLRQVEKVLQLAGDFNRLPVPTLGDPVPEFAVFSTSGGVTEAGTELVAAVELGFRLTATVEDPAAIPEDLFDKSTERAVIALVRGAYLVEYGLGDGDELSTADVDDFCERNAVHTVWPFWREFVTSSLMRSGLESVPVPPYTVYGPPKAPVTYERGAGRRPDQGPDQGPQQGPARGPDKGPSKGPGKHRA